jgi:hypothetical protein
VRKLTIPGPGRIADATPLRLDVAAALEFPDGSMTAAGLRREAGRGRLVVERIAGKDYTTLGAINRLRELCRLDQRVPASGSSLPGEKTTARSAEQAVWVIRDGNRKISTGCGPDARREAEKRLASYIVERYVPDKSRARDPAEIQIADVLSIYIEDRGPQMARRHRESAG